MEHADFSIGCEFRCGGKRWRCTDRGKRTVTAICLSDHADDPSWFNGPPYAVVESVFDEYDFAACSPLDAASVDNGRPQILTYLQRRDAELTTAELRATVSLRHLDGSVLLLHHACVERHDDWICVFAEHHPPLVYHAEDLHGWLSVDPDATPQSDDRSWHYQVYTDSDGEHRIYEDYRDETGARNDRTRDPVAPAGATHDELIADLCYMLLDATLYPAEPLDGQPADPH
ncbi:MAG: hypothetical protein ACOCZK_03815 [Planctomycetota bacterium]